MRPGGGQFEGGCATVTETELPLFMSRPKTIDQRPQVTGRKPQADYDQLWNAFEHIALLFVGLERECGAKGIFELIRWFSKLENEVEAIKIFKIVKSYRKIETPEGEYHINNDLTSDFSRRFTEKYPQHKNFFEQRLSRKDLVF